MLGTPLKFADHIHLHLSTAVVEVYFESSAYNTTEGDNNLTLCVLLDNVPSEGLEDSLVVDLEFINGSIAGEYNKCGTNSI